MERYDARFCRNSVMTSLAGSKSWNFCGRRGVNSSTALRTVAGSNEDIGWNGLDLNWEMDWPPDGHGEATARIFPGRSMVANKLRPGPVCGHGLFTAADCLWTIHVRCRVAFTDN